MKNSKRPVPELCITGLGLVTSVGHDHKTACASIRAGLRRSTKLPNYYAPSKKGYDDFEDGLVTGHPVFGDEPENREARIMKLLSMALSDLKKDAGLTEADLKDTGVFLALPETKRCVLAEDDVKDCLLLIDTWPFSEETAVKLYPLGHAGMLFALSDAAEAIQRGDLTRALVAGADSLINFDDLSRLDDLERLKTKLNTDGLMPGEAASAILMEKTAMAKKRGTPIKSLIRVVSTAHEPEPRARGLALGTGLTHALKGILSPDKKAPVSIDAIFSDLNGEPCRFEEWSMVQARIMNHAIGEKELICPAKNVGDTGAASAGLAICLASRAMERGYLSSNPNHDNATALIISSSDTGERAALLLGTYVDEV